MTYLLRDIIKNMITIDRKSLVDTVAQNLYDDTQRGVMVFRNALNEQFRELLLQECLNNVTLYEPKRGKYKNAMQDFESVTVHPTDFGAIAPWRAAHLLYYGFEKYAAALGAACQFDVDTTPEMSIQRYKRFAKGLSCHRDERAFRNLIALFVVDGTAPFIVSDDREGTNAMHVPASPGSLILMRAPRHDAEDKRPYHELREAISERYSIGIRYKKNNYVSHAAIGAG